MGGTKLGKGAGPASLGGGAMGEAIRRMMGGGGGGSSSGIQHLRILSKSLQSLRKRKEDQAADGYSKITGRKRKGPYISRRS